MDDADANLDGINHNNNVLVESFSDFYTKIDELIKLTKDDIPIDP